jgi:protein tyrosine/serine phosphatase
MKPELYWIEGPWTGKLAISGRPRGNEWLEDEVEGWKASGIHTVVSLLTSDEQQDLGLEDEKRLSRLNGIDFIPFPVADRSVPPDFDKAVQLIRTIEAQLVAGKNVALHCRQGIGRSALVAASVLVAAGVEPGTAFAGVGGARGCSVPETTEQRDWVIQFSREVPALHA